MSRTRSALRTLFVLYFITAIGVTAIQFPEPTLVVRHWYQARLGMTKAEVTSLFGTPTATFGPGRIEVTGGGDSPPVGAAIGVALLGGLDERWEYGPPHIIDWQPSKEFLRFVNAIGSAGSSRHTSQEFQEIARRVPAKEREMFMGGFPFGNSRAFRVAFDEDGKVTRLNPPEIGIYSDYRRIDPIMDSIEELESRK